MKQSILLGCFLFASCFQHAAFAQPEQAKQYQKQAAILAQDFIGTLKPMLKKAITEKGPVHAIEVCSTEAPKIARSLGELSGWEIKRVSLKARNPNAKPDDWETKQLALFDKLQKQGVPGKTLNVWSLEQNRFRYLQAQTTQGLCLVCHGQNIAPNVKKALAKHYPNDEATGYQLGEVRGAISLSKSID